MPMPFKLLQVILVSLIQHGSRLQLPSGGFLLLPDGASYFIIAGG